MLSDIEMGDSDSSILDSEVTLGPEIVVNIKPTPERVVRRCKEYLRHLEVRAAGAPSIAGSVEGMPRASRDTILLGMHDGMTRLGLPTMEDLIIGRNSMNRIYESCLSKRVCPYAAVLYLSPGQLRNVIPQSVAMGL